VQTAPGASAFGILFIEGGVLFRYLDEQGYRFNNRKTDDATRFATMLASVPEGIYYNYGDDFGYPRMFRYR